MLGKATKSHDSRCRGQDANRSPAEYESGALLSHLPALSCLTFNRNSFTRYLWTFAPVCTSVLTSPVGTDVVQLAFKWMNRLFRGTNLYGTLLSVGTAYEHLESITNIIYRVIRNDCRSFNNFSYTIHLRQEYFFLFNRTTLQVFVAYLTGALYVHPLCVESFRSLDSLR